MADQLIDSLIAKSFCLRGRSMIWEIGFMRGFVWGQKSRVGSRAEPQWEFGGQGTPEVDGILQIILKCTIFC